MVVMHYIMYYIYAHYIEGIASLKGLLLLGARQRRLHIGCFAFFVFLAFGFRLSAFGFKPCLTMGKPEVKLIFN